jgi:hypothetical protein
MVLMRVSGAMPLMGKYGAAIFMHFMQYLGTQLFNWLRQISALQKYKQSFCDRVDIPTYVKNRDL